MVPPLWRTSQVMLWTPRYLVYRHVSGPSSRSWPMSFAARASSPVFATTQWYVAPAMDRHSGGNENFKTLPFGTATLSVEYGVAGLSCARATPTEMLMGTTLASLTISFGPSAPTVSPQNSWLKNLPHARRAW